MQCSARRMCVPTLARLAGSAFQNGAVIGFEGEQRRTEQLATRHHHDVESCRKSSAPENLSYQSFSSVSLDGAAQLLRRGDPQPTRRLVVGENEQRAEAAANAGAPLVDVLKFSMTADPLTTPKTSIDVEVGAHSRAIGMAGDSCQLSAIRC